MSCLTTSATRRSRSVPPAVLIASAAASSHEVLLVPMISVTLYTLITISFDHVRPAPGLLRLACHKATLVLPALQDLLQRLQGRLHPAGPAGEPSRAEGAAGLALGGICDEGGEYQTHVPTAGVIARYIWCDVRHLQVSGIDVVQDYGTVQGFALLPAQLLQLLGDVADPPIRDPPYGRYRGRMLRVSEQGDLGSVGRAAVEGGLQELSQAFSRIGLMLQVLDD